MLLYEKAPTQVDALKKSSTYPTKNPCRLMPLKSQHLPYTDILGEEESLKS